MILNGNLEFLIVLESDLYAILVSQEAGDLVTAIALGNSSSRPDQDTHRLFGRAKKILVSLDADDAGAEEA